jgi:hypothetical protein
MLSAARIITLMRLQLSKDTAAENLFVEQKSFNIHDALLNELNGDDDRKKNCNKLR